MEIVERILESSFNSTGWTITKPERGISKESYVAERDGNKVFVKFDVSPKVLELLSVIGVAPKVLASGESDERSYIVQEFIKGAHPSTSWFIKHLKEVAEFVRRYHQYKQLTDLLDTKKYNYEQYIQRDLRFMEEELSTSPLVNSPSAYEMFDQIKGRSYSLKNSVLTPVHADPNSDNFLISDNGFYMIDWDDVYLSDPMRDIAMILFRFYPKDKWNEFLTYYGSNLDEEKLYYWIARDCLGIATWFAKREDTPSEEMYLKATKAALQKEDNPFRGEL